MTKTSKSLKSRLTLKPGIFFSVFSDNTAKLSLKELSEKTGLYKSRILRLCGTLMAHGFLIRSDEAMYSLGPKLMMLGKVYERTNSLVSLARPVLHELAMLTGESTKLFVIEGAKRLCLIREEGFHPLRYAVNEGETFELHAGASGKVLLAFSSEEFCHKILSKTLEKITPTTIIDRSRLEQEFELIRQRGYASSIGEVVPEVAGIAAPVFDHANHLVGALTIAGSDPTVRRRTFSGDVHPPAGICPKIVNAVGTFISLWTKFMTYFDQRLQKSLRLLKSYECINNSAQLLNITQQVSTIHAWFPTQPLAAQHPSQTHPQYHAIKQSASVRLSFSYQPSSLAAVAQASS